MGVRETADDDHHCFRSDAEVQEWLSGKTVHGKSAKVGLFAYPGQSNMTGRRLPWSWPGMLRASEQPNHQDTYSLLDAAALATTAPLNGIFRDPELAPDFTVLSFYKIFGYPDLGGLIVRKSSGSILQWGRKYFGGGTVQMVTVLSKKPWYKPKASLHESLEDGTLPFHNIIALKAAIDTHRCLYGQNCMTTISRHTTYLGKRLYDQLSGLVHSNGLPVCQIYKGKESVYGDPKTQGATIAFNVRTADGKFVPYTSVVETLANKRKIYVRAGQLCNPGGIATHLRMEDWHLKRLWSEGHRCGAAHLTGTEIMNGKPTGVVRVSLGAMTTIGNIDALIAFLREEFMAPVQGRGDRGMAVQIPMPMRPAPSPVPMQMNGQMQTQTQTQQVGYRPREERGYTDRGPEGERQFSSHSQSRSRGNSLSMGIGMRSQEYLISSSKPGPGPGLHHQQPLLSSHIFPPTPSVSGESVPPTRAGTPSYRLGGRSSFSGAGDEVSVGRTSFPIMTTPRRMEDLSRGFQVPTEFGQQQLKQGTEMESFIDGGHVAGDEREERSDDRSGIKRLWKHKVRKQSVA